MTDIRKAAVIAIVTIIFGSAVVMGAALLGYRTARSDSGSAEPTIVVPAPVASGSGSAIVPPHDQLHDPMTQPQEALTDIQKLKQKGWLATVTIGLYMLCMLLSKLQQRFPKLARLGDGRVAAIVAASGTVLAGCVDVVMLGGSYITVGAALIIGIVALLGTSEKKATA